MKPNSGYVRRAIAGAAVFVIVAGLLNAADGATPTIEMENIPLSEAIRNVTRQMELNYIIHPSLLTPGGMLRSNPHITVSWPNITLRQALERLLKEHGLAIVTNSATTVARIVPTGAEVKPVSFSAAATDTNGVIRVLSMEDPLPDVIRAIASRAHLEVTFAPETSRVFESADVFRSQVTTEFRWQNITASQALAALLDNYDLIAVADPTNSSIRIALRPPASGKNNGKAKEP